MPSIVLGDRTVPYKVRRSTRARRIRLTFSAKDGLQLVLPSNVSLSREYIENILYQKYKWILNALERLEYYEQNPEPPRLFEMGEDKLFLGQVYKLELQFQPHCQGAQVLGKTAAVLVVEVQEGLNNANETRAIYSALMQWYQDQAKRYITQRTAELASIYGFQYNMLRIRDQKTRWGSCSGKGNLNFNWRLIMAPPSIIDYVIVHELCHLQQMNHSQLFWKLVERFMPDYETHRAWLKYHGHLLLLY